MLNQGTITVQSKRKTIGLAKDIDPLREANDTYWRQRSRVEWQVKGDRNTSFFHVISAQRGRANLITALQKEDGEWVRDHQGIYRVQLISTGRFSHRTPIRPFFI
ncbi:hypothetical protein LIER_18814 [Lithospermum erythrorhizon]|uniref:Uncharacterized protein n=1 Tax=Lithospermum erythrorhizon TaxID=34254 RepID=A0AAV3QI63_LITER